VSAVSAEAFDRLVAEHRPEVLRICRAIVRDEHLGADAAQEAWLRLWRRSRTQELPTLGRAWLRKAAVSSALDLVRRRSVRQASVAPDVPPDEAPDPRSTASPPGAAAHAELQAALDRAVAGLPDRQRLVFLLRHEGGLSLTEVADTLDIALPTAKTQFARAVLKLQSRLRAFRPEERHR
jgi:RNA polymerase sigma-70 factor (ECF subfamily)